MAKYLIFCCLASAAVLGCGKSSSSDQWVASPGLTVTPYLTQENGKNYLDVIYENFGRDTIEKIKYEFITVKGGKSDTTEKEIDPPKVLKPKDRHLVERPIGEQPADYDEVRVGKIWIVRQ